MNISFRGGLVREINRMPSKFESGVRSTMQAAGGRLVLPCFANLRYLVQPTDHPNDSGCDPVIQRR